MFFRTVPENISLHVALQLLGRLVHGRACCSQGELVRQFQSKWEGAPVARRQLLDALQALGPERPRGGNCWRLPAPSLQRLGMPLSRSVTPNKMGSRSTVGYEKYGAWLTCCQLALPQYFLFGKLFQHEWQLAA